MKTTPARHPYEDGPALADPVIRTIMTAFALVALAFGAAILLTPLLRFGLHPGWIGSFIIVQPIVGLIQERKQKRWPYVTSSISASR
jgi:fatty acid desaturase